MLSKEKYTPLIEVKDLLKSFNELLVLNKISFSIHKGEILSVLGPSGSGKTTLLKCLIGLENFNSADDSVSISGITRNEYLSKTRIAFVPQRYSNYPWLNVFENIKLGMINHNKVDGIFKLASLHVPPSLMPNPWGKETESEKQFRLVNEEKNNRVNEIIETVGLKGFEKYSIDKLSGGMQQRVAIGRILAQDTDIIAFDEPFGALDFNIREKLQLLVKKLNKTILFVTHDIEEALFIADKMIVLSQIPTTVLANFKLSFKSKFDTNIKFERDFIQMRKEIQHILNASNSKSTEVKDLIS